MAAAASMYLQEENATAEMDQAERHFAETQRLMEQITSDSLDRRAWLYSQEATLECKQATALRIHALDISRRECLRDTLVAHAGNVQASLFVATVLIGFGYELISGAIVSEQWEVSNPGAVFCFMVLSMLSIALGMASVALLLQRYYRLSIYDFEAPHRTYSCGHAHPEMVDYCECRCRHLERWAHYLLVASVTAGSAAIMICSVDKFQNNPGGGVAAKSWVFQNLTATRLFNSSAQDSNSSTASRISAIRSVGAPFAFCLIVGVSVLALVVLDFSLLSSDTRLHRPEFLLNQQQESTAASTPGAAAKRDEEEEEPEVVRQASHMASVVASPVRSSVPQFQLPFEN